MLTTSDVLRVAVDCESHHQVYVYVNGRAYPATQVTRTNGNSGLALHVDAPDPRFTRDVLVYARGLPGPAFTDNGGYGAWPATLTTYSDPDVPPGYSLVDDVAQVAVDRFKANVRKLFA
jgi:hypothetical protein